MVVLEKSLSVKENCVHIKLPFEVREEGERLTVSFCYAPKTVDDKAYSERLLKECFEKYVSADRSDVEEYGEADIFDGENQVREAESCGNKLTGKTDIFEGKKQFERAEKADIFDGENQVREAEGRGNRLTGKAFGGEYSLSVGAFIKKYTPLKNLLTFSLDSPSGVYVGDAHRHDANQVVFVSEKESSPGFLPHKIEKGEWTLTLSVFFVEEKGVKADIRAEVF
ncbi:MAG: hypothetical protein LBP62_06790 [Clostridiales bacterium]|jgi:hypothetical protein|nr:hypothetical protein [Clostridiales bacterium]